MGNTVYFDNNRVMSPREASYRWGIKRNTLIAALNRGRFDEQGENGDVRKFTLHGGRTVWYITPKAMTEVYGDIKITD